MRAKAKSIALSALLAIGVSAAKAQQTTTRQPVRECGPDGGFWGPDNLLRDKIEIYSDGAAVYMSQHFAEQNKTHWLTSAPFHGNWGGLENAIGKRTQIDAEGDGFKVSTHGGKNHFYFTHFSCKSVAAAR